MWLKSFRGSCDLCALFYALFTHSAGTTWAALGERNSLSGSLCVCVWWDVREMRGINWWFPVETRLNVQERGLTWSNMEYLSHAGDP